jgi:hypothetical protein
VIRSTGRGHCVLVRLSSNWLVAPLWILASCGDPIPSSDLVAIVPEPPGANCPAGGNVVQSGTDLDGDGVLDPAEVEDAAYLCNPIAPPPQLVDVDTEPPGPNCPSGGVAITSGADLDADGILDADEVASVSYVCAEVGVPTLVVVVPEPAGTNCSHGGQAIQSGPDADANGVLDADEIASVAYVCDGADGAEALIRIDPEPPGPHCAYGGSAIGVGLDANGNGVLEPGETAHTSYVCDAAPTPHALVAVLPEPAGANCVNGGVSIQTGADVDGDSVLDLSEVTATSYVCSGAGDTTLISGAPEPPGVNCAHGGQAIAAGPDGDGDGVLDASEVTTTAFVCDGADGIEAKIRVDPEPPGANCASGGTAIGVGLDINGNGVLDPGEVESTTYLCGPPPAVTVIDGDVIVHNLVELAALDGVETITGSLTIHGYAITAPIALPSLRHVGVRLGCDANTPVAFPNLVSAEVIYLQGDTTEVDLHSLESVDSLVFDTPLTDLSLPALVTGAIRQPCGPPSTCHNSLETIYLPSLVSGSVNITVSKLTSFELPALQTATLDGITVAATTGTGLTTFDVPNIVSGSISIGQGHVASVSFPVLTSGDVTIAGDSLGSLSLPVLASGRVTVRNSSPPTISLPSLQTGGLALEHLPTLTSVSAPSLVTASEIVLNHTQSLATLSLPALEHTSALDVLQNAALTSISLPALTSLGDLHVIENPLLPTCQAQNLVTIATGSVAIFGNGTGTCP